MLFLATLAFGISEQTQAGGWSFTDVTQQAGLAYSHGYIDGLTSERRMIAGGAAAGDFDGDGWVDLYVIRGDVGPNLLFRNLGDGTFQEVGASAGVSGSPAMGCGATFADVDGDGWRDLLVGGFEGSAPVVWRNQGDGTFEDLSSTATIDNGKNQFSVALGDYDGDGDLDAAAAHWTGYVTDVVSLWRNDGSFAFTDVTAAADLDTVITFAFTPIFADIDDDGWLDLLVAADFGSSVALTNDGDGTFSVSVNPVITDENGMGAAVVDFDNDGLLDWFVSSIWDPDGTPEGGWGVTGNRLYRNTGNGLFTDVTDTAGVREGYWGWGSCFADFNNDGWPDLFHVNGFPSPAAAEFHQDPSRLFVAQGDGTFLEQSASLGVADDGQGRGVLCFDYDRDGDVDIFVANNSQPPKLYRNDGGNVDNFLAVRLEGNPPNTEGIGARITVTAGGSSQMREVRAGNNFASSDPPEVHFGLGASAIVDELRVDWPGGATSVILNVSANLFSVVSESDPSPPAVPDGSGGTAPMTVDKLDPQGSELSLVWDVSTCTEAVEHQIVYGGGSQLPSGPGGVYGLAGSLCTIGPPPRTWSGSPDPLGDGSGLLWWVIVANDGVLREGSWGRDSSGGERSGSGAGGASAECGMTLKDLTNGCGQANP